MSTTTPVANESTRHESIAFIGGGNMASAIIGGLIRQGLPAQRIIVIEPFESAQAKLQRDFGVTATAAPGEALQSANLVVWAVKPQTFKEAALHTRFHTKNAVHFSVAAGIRSESIAHWLGTDRVVRSMPNTPALAGFAQTRLLRQLTVACRVSAESRGFVCVPGVALALHPWLFSVAPLGLHADG